MIHDAIGIQSPRKFIAVFAIAGFIIFGCLGWLVDKGYRAKLTEQSKPSVNTTTGPQSPIMPNNNGTVTITSDGTKTAQAPPPTDKPK